ncbi:beta-1,3-glucan-binding protein 1 [Megalopta genalis]|uniref:beta-1,3-glucan-binding protein 1 n=1 Tax=Megalopta genalis TaxID=115081 RepID=UPI003FD573DE
MLSRGSFIVMFLVIFLKFEQFVAQENSNVLTRPSFTILSPNQIRVTIPDRGGLRFFAFNGNINRRITINGVGDISGEAFRPTDGKWTIEMNHHNLQNGNIIYYWIQGQINENVYTLLDQWTITNEVESNGGPPKTILFEENFDTLDSTIWERDFRIPLGPDYEFCVFHNEHHDTLLQIVSGKVVFKPLILEDVYGDHATAYGRMMLSKCTSNYEDECSRNATSFSILPPIISSRLTTKKRFNFRYGKIEIRAKFPYGDWLYPEMYLEPVNIAYGYSHNGRIILGLARGNDNLIDRNNSQIFDSRKVDFGFRISTGGHVDDYKVSRVKELGPRWTQDFHNYTTIWDENGFSFSVDGEEIGRMSPGPDGLLRNKNYHKIAPFDQQFYISIGLGVGGVRVFPDETMSLHHKKPWRNVGAKAMLNFWQAKNDWFPTWRKDDRLTTFEIDYIRVSSI